MSSFVTRLQEATLPDYRRRQGDGVVVNRRDLYEMVRDHARLDAFPRANHALGMLETQGQAGGLIAGIAERLTHLPRGWTNQHDDEHDDGALADAGVFYAMHPDLRIESVTAQGSNSLRKTQLHSPLWPFEGSWFDPDKFTNVGSSKAERKKELAVAISLLAAEWDRLDRAEKAEESDPE